MATYQELRTRSQQVRDEQNIGGNTALRVGQLLMDIVKYFNDNDEAASEYLQQHFAMVNDGTQLLNWQQSPIVILHTMGETYDDGDFSSLSQGENYYRAGFIMEANGQGGGINGETPKANVLYVNLANDTLYTWNGASFDAITTGGGGGISGDDILKNAYYLNGNLVLVFDTENGDKTVSIPVNFDASNYVPTSRTVNGKALSNNITIQMADIPGLETAIGEAGKVKTVSVNNGTPAQPDSNGNVNIEVQEGGQGPKGDKGDTVVVGGEQEFTIVNDTTTGGASDALSAEMGKRVAGREATDRQRIDAIVGILKKSVFTDDQTAAFAALDALANGIDSISFNASSHKFTGIGDTFTLNIVTDPAGKTAQVTWATSNASVATINNGVVTSIADGSAVITATTTDGKVAVCHIEVVTVVINGVSLNKSTLTLNGNDANETLIATTNPTGYESGVQWSSSDPTKATVDNNGKVTAVANGSAVITASIGGHSAACQVTVTGVMQTFHIGVGTLSNVTIEDGQGNAITDGQAVVEGSALTINFVPAASHEISALSVVMSGTSLDETDATDGTGGTKVITISSVTGDITISAAAAFVAHDYYNDGVDLNGFGVEYNTRGNFVANGAYKCRVIPLDFGKYYMMTYKWSGTPGGYNIAFVKSDGNGGYTNLINNTDVTAPTNRGVNDITYSDQNIYMMNPYTGSKQTVLFPVFDSSLYNVDKVYLAINTKFDTDVGVTECSVKEFNASPYIEPGYNLCIRYNDEYLGYGDGTYVCRIFEVEFGKTYSYANYQSGTAGAYNMGLAVIVDGVLRSLEKTEASSIDSFFSNGKYASRANAPSTGSFRVPSREELLINADKVFFVANLKFGTDDVDNSNFIITEAE